MASGKGSEITGVLQLVLIDLPHQEHMPHVVCLFDKSRLLAPESKCKQFKVSHCSRDEAITQFQTLER